MTDKLEYGEIKTVKFTKGAWKAIVEVTKPLKCTVEMAGTSEKNAVDKLKKFLNTYPNLT